MEGRLQRTFRLARQHARLACANCCVMRHLSRRARSRLVTGFRVVSAVVSASGHMSVPSVAITGIGVVSPYGVGRERFWQHVRNGCSATRTVTEFDATPYGSTVAAPVPRVSIDDAVTLSAARGGRERAERTAGSAAVLAGVAHRRDCRDRSVGGRRPARRRTGRRRARRQRRRRHRRRRAPVLRVLHRRLEARHAVRDSGLDRRHALERDFDRPRAARHQPRRLDRVHELDRRDFLRGVAHPERRGRGAAVGRRRRLRHAGDDVRVLDHARGVDALQRQARPRRRGRSTPAATASCSAKARGWSCSSARIARAPAARRCTRRSTATVRPATPITACRWTPTVRRSSARCGWRSSDRGTPSRRSATSTITGRRPC